MTDVPMADGKAKGGTGLVVQVRLGSTRLPGKALLPLGGSTMTDIVLSRLALIPARAYVLATDAASAPALGEIAERRGFDLVVGSPEDVLARYALVQRLYGFSSIIRATGDNPLVSPELATLLLAKAAGSGSGKRADYAAFLGMPLGMGVELICAEALLRADREASQPREREHVCPYLYGNPGIFAIDQRDAPTEYLLPAAKVTVDIKEDYEAVLRIYGALFDGSPIPTIEVIRFLKGAK